jgi:hypothetical protein
MSCEKNTLTTFWNVVPSNSTSPVASTNTTTTSRRLRYLQSNSTTTTTTTTPIVTYNQTYYAVITQDPADRKIVNIDDIITNYVNEVNTADKLNTFLADNNIKINGDYVVAVEVDTPLVASDFSLKEPAYTASTGIFSAIPVGPKTLTCDWKINNNFNVTQPIAMTSTDIKNCPAPANASDSVNCGKITFEAANTKVSQLNVGVLATGNWYVYVYCLSPLPQSINSVIFNTPNPIVIQPPTPTPTTTTSVVTCAEGLTLDATTGLCVNTSFITLSLVLLAFIAIFLFDF